MKEIRVTYWMLVIFLLGVFPAAGMVKLPPVLASGMVLQRETTVTIWGWASPGERVTVQANWLEEAAEAVTGADSAWKVYLPTGPAGGPYTLTIRGTNEIVLTDILFGEVWLCSGQSNMEFTINMLGGWKQYPDERKQVKRGDYNFVRLCSVTPAAASGPSDSCLAVWSSADLNTVANFSATAWFFAKALSEQLKVPVGVITAAVGGSPAEAWVTRERLETDPQLRFFLKVREGDAWAYGKPAALYNAMIHPLLNFSIRGVTWYQGEANVQQADLYQPLFASLIGCWRDAWRQPDLPFYFVQIAPYDYADGFSASAWLREAQQQTLSVPHTGMAVAADIGDPRDIHPKQKQAVGWRLALQALVKTYGRENFTCDGPFFERMERDGNRVKVFFSNAEEGLYTPDHTLQGFFLSGTDLQFSPAVATIDGSSVVLASNQVPDPVFVRFAFNDTTPSRLYNLAGLPAAPFRTDTLPLFIRDARITIGTDSLTGTPVAVMTCSDTTCSVRYTLDGTAPGFSSPLYAGPVPLTGTATIRARVFRGDRLSPKTGELHFYRHLGFGKPIAVRHPWSAKYPGGTNGLLDGIRGSDEFYDGHWQGYAGVPFDGTIDLGAPVKVGKVTIGFLHAQRSWIFLPTRVAISFSEDGIRFTDEEVIETVDDQQSGKVVIRDYTFTGQERPVRYIRITAQNMGRCPKWHPGKGKTAWIFADEIVIE